MALTFNFPAQIVDVEFGGETSCHLSVEDLNGRSFGGVFGIWHT